MQTDANSNDLPNPLLRAGNMINEKHHHTRYFFIESW